MSPESPEELTSFRSPSVSPRLRWMEIAGRTAIELLRLKHRAELLATANPNNPDVFHGFERETLKTLGGFVCQGLGWHITHNTDLPETLPSDRFVYFGNHPTLTAIWSWGAFLQEHFGTNIVAVGKKSVIENPLSRWFLGDLMRTAGKAIFIDRNNREEALSAIRSDAASLLTAGTGAVIFPDEHRPYPWRIRRQQEQWNLKRPDLEVSNWMTATCFPKSGGLWNFAEVIAGLDHVRFLDCTVVEPPSVFTFGAKLHFDVQEVSRGELLGVPESEEHLRGKLVELWQRKNEMIRERRSL